jgi:hypothetical protein
MADNSYNQRVQYTQKVLEQIVPGQSIPEAELLIKVAIPEAELLIKVAQTQATLAVAAATAQQTKVLESIGKDLADIRRMNARRNR